MPEADVHPHRCEKQTHEDGVDWRPNGHVAGITARNGPRRKSRLSPGGGSAVAVAVDQHCTLHSGILQISLVEAFLIFGGEGKQDAQCSRDGEGDMKIGHHVHVRFLAYSVRSTVKMYLCDSSSFFRRDGFDSFTFCNAYSGNMAGPESFGGSNAHLTMMEQLRLVQVDKTLLPSAEAEPEIWQQRSREGANQGRPTSLRCARHPTTPHTGSEGKQARPPEEISVNNGWYHGGTGNPNANPNTNPDPDPRRMKILGQGRSKVSP